MLTSSSDPDKRSRGPALNDRNRDRSIEDRHEKVVVCSETLDERRKLLGYFSNVGAPVILCSEPANVADALSDDVALLVVNAFDSDWSVGRWIDVMAGHPEDIPVIFIHQTAAAKDWMSDDYQVETNGDVSLVHVTEAGFRTLCDEGLLDIRTRIIAHHGDT